MVVKRNSAENNRAGRAEGAGNWFLRGSPWRCRVRRSLRRISSHPAAEERFSEGKKGGRRVARVKTEEENEDKNFRFFRPLEF